MGCKVVIAGPPVRRQLSVGRPPLGFHDGRKRQCLAGWTRPRVRQAYLLVERSINPSKGGEVGESSGNRGKLALTAFELFGQAAHCQLCGNFEIFRGIKERPIP